MVSSQAERAGLSFLGAASKRRRQHAGHLGPWLFSGLAKSHQRVAPPLVVRFGGDGRRYSRAQLHPRRQPSMCCVLCALGPTSSAALTLALRDTRAHALPSLWLLREHDVGCDDPIAELSPLAYSYRTGLEATLRSPNEWTHTPRTWRMKSCSASWVAAHSIVS